MPSGLVNDHDNQEDNNIPIHDSFNSYVTLRAYHNGHDIDLLPLESLTDVLDFDTINNNMWVVEATEGNSVSGS